VETRFSYDGLNPVQLLSSTGSVTDILTGLGIDEFLVSQGVADKRTLLTDALGSTLAELDGATVLAEYAYEPFGRTSVVGTPRTTFRYTGREDDDTGLYYYRARYYSPELERFLSEDPLQSLTESACSLTSPPSPFRYVQIHRDFIHLFAAGLTSLATSAVNVNPQLMHLHAYADNDPTNRRDPLGLLSSPQSPGCDWPARPIQWLSPCAKQCCDTHDRCYTDSFQFCDQNSWKYTLGFKGARPVVDCDGCNIEVVRCIVKTHVVGGRKDCATG